MRKTDTLCVFFCCDFFCMRKQIICTFLCFFYSHPHKKWRGCENKSIFPFISQYITVVFFILSWWHRKSKFISVRESTIPETHLPVLSGRYKNVLKYEFRTRGYKKFRKAIYQYYPEIAFYVLRRDHPKVLASDKMSTVSFRRHFVFSICVCEMFV